MAPIILAFEASTKHLSVAVYVNGSVLAMQKIEAALWSSNGTGAASNTDIGGCWGGIFQP